MSCSSSQVLSSSPTKINTTDEPITNAEEEEEDIYIQPISINIPICLFDFVVWKEFFRQHIDHRLWLRRVNRNNHSVLLLLALKRTTLLVFKSRRNKTLVSLATFTLLISRYHKQMLMTDRLNLSNRLQRMGKERKKKKTK